MSVAEDIRDKKIKALGALLKLEDGCSHPVLVNQFASLCKDRIKALKEANSRNFNVDIELFKRDASTVGDFYKIVRNQIDADKVFSFQVNGYGFIEDIVCYEESHGVARSFKVKFVPAKGDYKDIGKFSLVKVNMNSVSSVFSDLTEALDLVGQHPGACEDSIVSLSEGFSKGLSMYSKQNLCHEKFFDTGLSFDQNEEIKLPDDTEIEKFFKRKDVVFLKEKYIDTIQLDLSDFLKEDKNQSIDFLNERIAIQRCQAEFSLKALSKILVDLNCEIEMYCSTHRNIASSSHDSEESKSNQQQ
ncbi:hypothetical protein HYD_0560 [Candidatus Hydrogenosomobacter endosymbioticus]|uniref:Uncharacterized protein n=1 Tax=Candidatus Hydrogenosomobacter endosymbioticus TaxID=2558174 RepID=A0ABN6L243_9PROT|nr:hypothetical protein HYD_0560 [Candidatus Hydrogenosomobacter endosymbioticus]